MKILILADIHSNWSALSAIPESFDACLFLGDLVDYGSDPLPCLEWLKQHATATVRGNHDHAVAQMIAGKNGRGFSRLATATRQHHWDILNASHRKFLGRFPVKNYLQLDGIRFLLVHATPKDPMDEHLHEQSLEWDSRLKNIDADIVCVGHTHKPFHKTFENCQLINPGSIGLPRDGDPRGSYAMIENGQLRLERFEYDIDAAISQMKKCDLPVWVADLMTELLKTGCQLTKAEMDQFV